jgi:hypothetical protein
MSIYIWMIIGDRTGLYLDLDLDLVRQSERGSGCSYPPMSIEGRPLLWMVARS